MKRFLVFSLLAVTLSGCIVVPGRGHGHGGYRGDRGYYQPPPQSGHYYYPSRGGPRPYWR